MFKKTIGAILIGWLVLLVTHLSLIIPVPRLTLNATTTLIADAFDYPLGALNSQGVRNADGYHLQQPFEEFGRIYSHEYHTGEDWQNDGGGASSVGNPVFAVANGTVLYAQAVAGSPPGFPGGVVIIQHTLADGSIWYSMYGHLGSVTVTSGTVTIGQQIGTIGVWPGDITNSHLHFEIRKFYKTDPMNGSNPDNSRHTNYPPGPGYWPSNPAQHHGCERPDARGWTDPSNFINTHRRMPSLPNSIGNITGFVKDSVSGNPVCNANVTFMGSLTTRTVSTDESGHYLFYDVPAGSAKITVSKAGVGTGSVNFTVLANATGLVPDITLIPASVPTRLDLIFVIDTTASMHNDIDAVKISATDIINRVATKVKDYRIALVDYKDIPPPNGPGEPGDYPAKTDLAFTTDKVKAINAIQGLTVGGGGDIPESVYSGLRQAILDSQVGGWRNGAIKQIILMGDAPPHDPEPITNYTLQTIFNAANSVDPAVIQAIAAGNNLNTEITFSNIANATGGKLFIATTTSDIVQAILGAINEATNPLRSTAYLPLVRMNNNVTLPPTATPTRTPVPLNTPTSTPQPINTPTPTWTPMPPNTPTPMPGQPPAAPSNLQATAQSATQIHITWQDNANNETGFAVYDGNTFVTNVSANATSYTIGGLSPGSYHCFTVYAYNSYGTSGFPGWACATTPSNSCLTSAGTWQNTPIANQTGTFAAEFDGTPNNAPMDGVMGFSAGPANAYASLAAIARFSPTGYIDARNGGAYQAVAQIPYTAGASYHFRMQISIPNHTYSVFVTPAGGSEQLVGANFAFRTEQSGVTSLNNFAMYAKTGSHQVCNIAISPAPNLANLSGTWTGILSQDGTISFFVSSSDIAQDGYIQTRR